MITNERFQEMQDAFWAETNDPATEAWRDNLTDEEAKIVARWDERVNAGITELYNDLEHLREEEHHAEGLSDGTEPTGSAGNEAE